MNRGIWVVGLVALSMGGCDVFLNPADKVPVALAGDDQVVGVGANVVLDGSGSYDPEDKPLGYTWELVSWPEGATAELSTSDEALVNLVPDVFGEYRIQLVVSDGQRLSEPDVVQVTAEQGCESDAECDDGVTCTADVCNPDTGGCSNEPDDLACGDGLVCNGTETCDPVDGCLPGTTLDCDDGVSCTVDACDEDAEGCTSQADDPSCDDGNPCTDDSCDPSLDCLNTAGSEGGACSVGACIGTCGEGVCQGCTCDAPADCDDGIGCTIEVCNAGACSYSPDDGECDDGQWCTGVETCDLVLGCQAGVDRICDDGVDCTQDSCDEDADSCVGTLDDGACDDGAWCNGAETCDAVLDCQAGADPCPGLSCDEPSDACITCIDDTDCDDGQVCNGQETCAGDCQDGADRPSGPVCDGADLVTCDGAGAESDRTTCALGCRSAAGNDRCYRVAPSNLSSNSICDGRAPLVVSAGSPVVIDTDAGTITGVSAGDIVYSQVSQSPAPGLGVFAFDSVTILDDVTVTGSRALVLVACSDVSILAVIDASASGQQGGPAGGEGGDAMADGVGAPSGVGGGGFGENVAPWRRTGGGGGALGGDGGAGGDDDDALGGVGGSAYGPADLIPLLGGSGGGGAGFLDGGHGGGGGGAVQVSAGGDLMIGAGAGINVGGGGGLAPINDADAGGGGGAGGGILLEAPNVNVAGILAANGGGGAGAWEYTQPPPTPGQEGPFGLAQAVGGLGGGAGGAGGDGGGVDTPAGLPGESTLGPGGGGGGGGAGLVRINTATGTANVSGEVSPTAAGGLFSQGPVAAE